MILKPFGLPGSADDALPHLTYFLLDSLHFPTFNYELHVDDVMWDELAKLVVQSDALHYYCSILETIATVLGFACPMHAAPRVLELNKFDLPVLAPQSTNHLVTPVFLNQSVAYTKTTPELRWNAIREGVAANLPRRIQTPEEANVST